MAINLPEKGFIFWPVGTGDSTTIRVQETVFLQIDLRHMEKSENDDDAAWPIIDELTKILPTLKGRPYLSTFALSHPDMDHCQGFEELNNRVLISELWMSPRTFREFKEKEELCDDAEAFHKEAMRRVRATIKANGDPGRGNRIRIIGYDTLLQEQEFTGFPKQFLSIPGHTISQLDGQDYSAAFEAFVHAPFKEDSFGDRNDCSLAFQISLFNGGGIGRALLMGDLNYPIIRKIFNRSHASRLRWNILLAPHHCSKSVMYWAEDGKDETLQENIVRDLGNTALDIAYVVSSSDPIPPRNQTGDNPPHAKAKAQYERIVPNRFLCTHEHPDKKNPQPIIFEVGTDSFKYVGEEVSSQPLMNALEAVRGPVPAPTTAVGFGRGPK